MTIDDRQTAWLLSSQHGVLSRAQAARIGVTASGLQHRLRPGGPWQRLLPGVYMTVTGQPTREQLQVAALLYAGKDSVITGLAAVRNHRIKVPETDIIDVLLPAGRKRRDCLFVRVHRTWQMPQSVVCEGVIRFAPAERAVADAVRGLTDVGTVRAVVAGAVQSRACTVAQLGAELAAGGIRRSALLRQVLAEVADGVRSPAEAQFRRLILRSRLPRPLFNPDLFLPGRVFLARPDAWWPEFGVAAEVDSREWHILPADWEETMARHRRMSAAGISVQHFSPRQLGKEPAQILTDLGEAIRHGRPLPGITTIPAAA